MSPESNLSYLVGYNLLEVELLNLSQTENLIEPVVSELIASPQSIPSILTAWAESQVSVADLCFSVCCRVTLYFPLMENCVSLPVTYFTVVTALYSPLPLLNLYHHSCAPRSISAPPGTALLSLSIFL